MTDNKRIPVEVSLLYSIVAMLKACNQYKEFIEDSAYKGNSSIHFPREIKQDLNMIPAIMRRLSNSINHIITKSDAENWRQDWDRDYMGAAGILACWSAAGDEDRLMLERVVENLTADSPFSKYVPFFKIQDVKLIIGERYLIVKKLVDKVILETTYHNEKLGFYSVTLSQYIPLTDIELICIL